MREGAYGLRGMGCSGADSTQPAPRSLPAQA